MNLLSKTSWDSAAARVLTNAACLLTHGYSSTSPDLESAPEARIRGRPNERFCLKPQWTIYIVFEDIPQNVIRARQQPQQ